LSRKGRIHEAWAWATVEIEERHRVEGFNSILLAVRLEKSCVISRKDRWIIQNRFINGLFSESRPTC